jgi:[acyl-carrier-protein] S-malonyltransferase
MLPVSQELRKYIGDMQINKGDIAFFSASEKSFCSYEQITQVLAEQLLKTINWLESIEILLEKGADVFIEIGPGKVLSGLVKRIASKKGKEVKIFNTDNLEQISFLKKFLNEGN